MKSLDLTTQSDIQLELLLAREKNMLESFNFLLDKIEAVCKEDMDLTLEQVLEYYEYSNDRLTALQTEMALRQPIV